MWFDARTDHRRFQLLVVCQRFRREHRTNVHKTQGTENAKKILHKENLQRKPLPSALERGGIRWSDIADVNLPPADRSCPDNDPRILAEVKGFGQNGFARQMRVWARE